MTDDQNAIGNFTFHFGCVHGAADKKVIVDYLRSGGATDEQIKALINAMRAIVPAFNNAGSHAHYHGPG